jgi:hypothetical protein
MVVEIFVETENCLDFSMPKILIDMKKWERKIVANPFTNSFANFILKYMKNLQIPGPGEHDNYTCNCVPHDMKIIYQVKVVKVT